MYSIWTLGENTLIWQCFNFHISILLSDKYSQCQLARYFSCHSNLEVKLGSLLIILEKKKFKVYQTLYFILFSFWYYRIEWFHQFLSLSYTKEKSYFPPSLNWHVNVHAPLIKLQRLFSFTYLWQPFWPMGQSIRGNP